MDSKGNKIFDSEGKPILVDKNGKIIKHNELKLIILDNGKPLVDENNRLILGIDRKVALDENGKPITLPKPLLDKNNKLIQGVQAEIKSLDKANNIKGDLEITGKDGNPIEIDGKKISGIQVKPFTDKEWKEVTDAQGNKLLIDSNGNIIKYNELKLIFHGW